MPPHLAGRVEAISDFKKLLEQKTILQNVILTGLRGLGKTVLLETLKPLAIAEKWLWAGADLSESTSISEDNLATRIITDLSIVTSAVTVHRDEPPRHFQQPPTQAGVQLDYRTLRKAYESQPGLPADKLKAVLESVWSVLSQLGARGVIFAYDEAQNLADHNAKEQFPLSLLLDVFQSIQRKDIPFMLVLTGLPTLQQKLVESRTYSERMFHVIDLGPLNAEATKEAIVRPINKSGCPINFTDASIDIITKVTKGYPYFVQYVCKEAFDVWVQDHMTGREAYRSIPIEAIMLKLDADFFSGRWKNATDRQRELLTVIASVENDGGEFSVQELELAASARLERPFSTSGITQMLTKLSELGLVFKNRHGKYSLAVPLMAEFIKRQVMTEMLPFPVFEDEGHP